MGSKRLFLLASLLLLLVSACTIPVRQYPVNPGNPIFTVAVLPIYNATNDAAGPETVRTEFVRHLAYRHYLVQPVKETDELLLTQMGITLGSQLELTTPEKVGETLGVDGVVYGYLINFDDVTAGVYNVKRVRAGFKLIETKTGRVVWSGGLGVKSIISGGDAGAAVTILKEIKDMSDGEAALVKSIEGAGDIPGIMDWHIIRAFGTEKIGDAAVIALGEKIITKAFKVHLKLETGVMIKRLMTGFPSGPGPVPQPGSESGAVFEFRFGEEHDTHHRPGRGIRLEGEYEFGSHGD